jgi:hypothetical protein
LDHKKGAVAPFLWILVTRLFRLLALKIA